MTTPRLVENFFRHEYGRLVSTLSNRFGVEQVEDIEDAVQAAMLTAIENWTIDGLPDNPSAWLFRVANNNLLGELRKGTRRRKILRDKAPTLAADLASEKTPEFEPEDDLLQMLFVCCDETIPRESQLIFALKTLCGFGVREIACRLFMSEANVYKRLGRARQQLKKLSPSFAALSDSAYSTRLSSVHSILYLLFTEGYLSSCPELAIRRELCDEAIRLAEILADHPVGQSPETFALLALMHFHSARMTSRQDKSRGLLLLEEQNRRLWDQEEIRTGLKWLAKSAAGESFSRYHAEAGIAAEHCLAKSFEETRWDRVDECYSLLEQFIDSPLHKLNRAVVIAQWKGPNEALALLHETVPPSWLSGSHLWAAVLSDLHRRCGNFEKSKQFRQTAFDSAPSPQVRELLRRRLEGPQKYPDQDSNLGYNFRKVACKSSTLSGQNS